MGTRFRNLYQSANCFFITSTMNEWLGMLVDERYFKILDDSLMFVCNKYSAHIIAYVWMKNHIHVILFFDKQAEFSNLMRDFKKFTGRQIRLLIQNDGKVDLLEKLKYEYRTQEFKVWKDRFDVVQIMHKEILFTKINYIHNNPVRKGYCNIPEDYKYSSAGFYSGMISRLQLKHASEIVF